MEMGLGQHKLLQTPPYNFCVGSLSSSSDWDLINNDFLLILHALQILFPYPIAMTFKCCLPPNQRLLKCFEVM